MKISLIFLRRKKTVKLLKKKRIKVKKKRLYIKVLKRKLMKMKAIPQNTKEKRLMKIREMRKKKK